MQDNIVFVRVDDRLIHGQIVNSWLNVYRNIRHIICIDDFSSKDPFMQKMFQLLIPEDISVEIKSVNDSIDSLKSGLDKPTMIIVKSPMTIKTLIDADIDIDKFNIGGMGMSGKRRRFHQNISVDDEEKAIMLDLINKGVKIEIQVIPDQQCYDCEEILKND
ncbi:MAG: PTS sugar transporter subunit IIB [Bacillota bacterium]|jgi:mannose/fructose/N-acetylgalactosamine-specific phosphotransferase system component IIB|nr:PTS sugar transporter subunit IIB [Bacillota bacterium]NLL25868.1 PTS sugar transporter subunit IIB [Erysipelotrichia bacterium]